jgi:hypothetical protein
MRLSRILLPVLVLPLVTRAQDATPKTDAAIEGMGLTVDIALAEGEYIAARWTLVGIVSPGKGTPQAVGAAPQLLCTGNDIYRVEANLIAELWQETVTCA